MILSAKLHKRVAAIGFQTAMLSYQWLIYISLGGKYYLDSKPEKTRNFIFRSWEFHFAFVTLVDSLVGTITGVLLGAFLYNFPFPKQLENNL